MMGRHLSVRTLVGYDSDELRAGRRRRVRAHLSDCGRCRDALRRMREVREVAVEVTAPETPDVLSRVHARLDGGEVVLLPRADPAARSAAGRARVRPAVAATLVALTLGASVAAAAGLLTVPSWLQDAPEPAAPVTPSGIEVEVPAGRFTVEIHDPAPGVRISVREADGELLEVWGGAGAEEARFASGPDFVRVAGLREGELRLGVPPGVGAIEVMIDGRLAALAAADGLRAPGGGLLDANGVPIEDLRESIPGERGEGPR